MNESAIEVSAQTGLLGVFGHPARHSLSPLIHNAAFREQGLDLVYLVFDVAPEHLGRAAAGVRGLGMVGVNLTVPHKESVVPLLDTVDPLAARVGAVNTIVNCDGSLAGYNTDIEGFSAALRSIMPEGPRDSECLIVGAGGAARAVAAALAEEGAGIVWVHNRTMARAEALCERAGKWGPTQFRPLDSRRLPEAVSTSRVVVNATPVGLEGRVKEFPVPVDNVHSGQFVVDLAYGVRTTALVKAAGGRGAVAIDGKEMLLMQAAGAYRLWTGLEAPIGAMRKSIDTGER